MRWAEKKLKKIISLTKISFKNGTLAFVERYTKNLLFQYHIKYYQQAGGQKKLSKYEIQKKGYLI